MACSEGRVPKRPIPPVVKGESSGTVAFPSSGLMIGAARTSASLSSSSVAPSAPIPARMTNFFEELRSSAADLSVSRCGTTIGARQAEDVWPRTICIDEISSEAVRSWISDGQVKCETLRVDRAERQARSTSSLACLAPRIMWL